VQGCREESCLETKKKEERREKKEERKRRKKKEEKRKRKRKNVGFKNFFFLCICIVFVFFIVALPGFLGVMFAYASCHHGCVSW